MMPSDIGLLSRCANFTLSHARDVENSVLTQLQTSAATPLVVALRVIRLQKTILVIGMFSIYESFLQRGMEWGSWAFDELERHLKQYGEDNLAQEFNDYRSAINVLKHGKGPSYERLLKRSSTLKFKVKQSNEALFLKAMSLK